MKIEFHFSPKNPHSIPAHQSISLSYPKGKLHTHECCLQRCIDTFKKIRYHPTKFIRVDTSIGKMPSLPAMFTRRRVSRNLKFQYIFETRPAPSTILSSCRLWLYTRSVELENAEKWNARNKRADSVWWSFRIARDVAMRLSGGDELTPGPSWRKQRETPNGVRPCTPFSISLCKYTHYTRVCCAFLVLFYFYATYYFAAAAKIRRRGDFIIMLVRCTQS